MQFSIIIVNWNSAKYLLRCVRSVYEHARNRRFEIIVVDNASFDRCGSMLKSDFPEVKFLQSKQNMGFARANNLAASHAGGRVLLFLNPDTEVRQNAIDEMLAVLNSAPGAGVVGCRLLNSDLSVQTSCLQSFPTITNQLLDSERLRSWFPESKLWGTAPLYSSTRQPAEVDAICGACLMIKRNVFDEVGFFSEDYFMYGEDVDLCYKVKQRGCRVLYLNWVDIVHHGGKSSRNHDDSYFSALVMKEARVVFFINTRGRAYARIYRTSIFLASLARIALMLLMWPLRKNLLAKFHLGYSLHKWEKILRWSLGLEDWVGELE